MIKPVSFGVLCLALTLAVQLAESAKNSKKTARIIGGTTTSISNARYLVYMRRYGTFACGGALVASRYVVTAAHCVYGYPRSSVTIHAGSSTLNGSNTFNRTLSRMFIPSDYNPSTLHMDVAVLKLRSALQGSKFGTIGLCSRSIPAGASMRVYGWGVTSANSGSPSNRLRTAVLTTRSKKSCNNSYRGVTSITRTMMCAAAARGIDTCAGDSGGPVIYRGELCGIVSWGIGCAQPAYPGVYTIVNKVKGFIRASLAR